MQKLQGADGLVSREANLGNMVFAVAAGYGQKRNRASQPGLRQGEA